MTGVIAAFVIGFLAGLYLSSLGAPGKIGDQISRDDVEALLDKAYRDGVLHGIGERSGPPSHDVVQDLITAAARDARRRGYGRGYRDAQEGQPFNIDDEDAIP